MWSSGSHRAYADLSRSTEEKLCLTTAISCPTGWKASDGMRIEVRAFSLNQNSERDMSLLAALELPGVESLPCVELKDPAAGETMARVSAIGMWLKTEHIDNLERIVLEYSDGTTYVVEDKTANLQNTEYVLGWGNAPEMEMSLCFNRLVDPAQVTAVTVDGQQYTVCR